jgi:hypothetical protein
MDRLIEWLPQHLPASARDDSQVSVVHGDFRLDNLMFHPTEPRVVAVLDWELSTLGHPLADFSYHCMAWHIPPGEFRGIGGLDLATNWAFRAKPTTCGATASAPAAPTRRADGRLELLPRLQPVPHRRHHAGHRQACRSTARRPAPGQGHRRRHAPAGRTRLGLRAEGLIVRQRQFGPDAQFVAQHIGPLRGAPFQPPVHVVELAVDDQALGVARGVRT